MADWFPILKWLSEFFGLVTSQARGLLALGLVILLLSVVYVLFVNFTAGEDWLLRLVARYAKLALIIVNGGVVSAICVVAAFIVIRQSLRSGS